jgi:hypothetical protein
MPQEKHKLLDKQIFSPQNPELDKKLRKIANTQQPGSTIANKKVL